MMLRSPTWMRSARSGSSLMAKMPRLVRGSKPVVDGQLVGQVAPLGDLDGVDLADQVGDGDVGRGQLLAVAAVARDPHDLGRRPPARRARLAAGPRDRRQGIVVDLGAGQRRDLLVEQLDKQARHARLGLAALAQEDDVLAAEDGVLDLGDDAVLEADDAREERLAAPETSR